MTSRSAWVRLCTASTLGTMSAGSPTRACFGRNVIGGHGVMCSVLTLTVGGNQGMRGAEFGRIYGIFSPEVLRLSVARPAASWT